MTIIHRIGCLAVLLLLGAAVAPIEARSFRVNQIPNGSENTCANCHTNPAGGGERNVFGQAVEATLSSPGGGGNVQWNATLAATDSDLDGATNGEELQDPTGAWRSGNAEPGEADLVTLPGSATSVPNRAPVIALIESVSGSEGVLVSLLIEATDADEDELTLGAAELPEGATFVNGTFDWTPGFDQGGDYDITFTADDGTSLVSLVVAIQIAEGNRLPSFTELAAQTVSEGALLEFTLEAVDEDEDTVIYASSDLPAGATLTDGGFSWTPDNEQAGEYAITFTASDGTGQVTLLVSVIVENVLIGPEITLSIPAGLTVSGAIDDTVRFTVETAVPVDAVATYTWTVDGDTTSETGSEYLHTVTGEDEVAVIVSDGSETAVRSWSIVQGITGDYDGDLKVAFSDFLIFVAAFGSREGDLAYEQRFDLVPDGRVDFEDFLIFVSHFGDRV